MKMMTPRDEDTLRGQNRSQEVSLEERVHFTSTILFKAHNTKIKGRSNNPKRHLIKTNLVIFVANPVTPIEDIKLNTIAL